MNYRVPLARKVETTLDCRCEGSAAETASDFRGGDNKFWRDVSGRADGCPMEFGIYRARTFTWLTRNICERFLHDFCTMKLRIFVEQLKSADTYAFLVEAQVYKVNLHLQVSFFFSKEVL